MPIPPRNRHASQTRYLQDVDLTGSNGISLLRAIGFSYIDAESGRKRKPEEAYIWLLAAEAIGASDVAPTLRELERELPPETAAWIREWVGMFWVS